MSNYQPRSLHPPQQQRQSVMPEETVSITNCTATKCRAFAKTGQECNALLLILRRFNRVNTVSTSMLRL